MTADELAATATALVAPGKGILAADEETAAPSPSASSPSTSSRPRTCAAPTASCCSPPRRRPATSAASSSTTRPSTASPPPTAPCPGCWTPLGIISGIKVDKGTTGLPGFPGEKITEGLDLADQLATYVTWGPVHQVAGGHRHRRGPAHMTIAANAGPWPASPASPRRPGWSDRRTGGADGRRPPHRALRPGDPGHPGRDLRRPAPPPGPLRRHAAQAEHGRLRQRRPIQAPVEEVARATVACLLDHVPASVPRVVFLSGGQSDQATAHLNAELARARPGSRASPTAGHCRPRPQGLEGRGSQRPGGSAGLRPPGPAERRRPLRQPHRGHGAGRRLARGRRPSTQRDSVADALARRVPDRQGPAVHYLVEALRELERGRPGGLRAVARTPTATLDDPVRRLSHAADNSKLWLGIAAVVALVGGRRGRQAALEGVVAIGVTSATVNLKESSRSPAEAAPTGTTRRRSRTAVPTSTRLDVVPLRPCHLGVRLRLCRRPPPARPGRADPPAGRGVLLGSHRRPLPRRRGDRLGHRRRHHGHGRRRGRPRRPRPGGWRSCSVVVDADGDGQDQGVVLAGNDGHPVGVADPEPALGDVGHRDAVPGDLVLVVEDHPRRPAGRRPRPRP